MITELEYLDAISTIKQYAEQIKNQTEEVLLPEVLTKTPKQINENWKIFFPTMCFRLQKILLLNFEDTRICDITQKEFLSMHQAGRKRWAELCNITGKEW
jgi:hypothetical protein